MTPPDPPRDLQKALREYEAALRDFEAASYELTSTIREGRVPSQELCDREEDLRAKLVEARRKTLMRRGV